MGWSQGRISNEARHKDVVLVCEETMREEFHGMLFRDGSAEVRNANTDGRACFCWINLRLLKHMGGMLDLECREGKTIFRLFLPIAHEGKRDRPE